MVIVIYHKIGMQDTSSHGQERKAQTNYIWKIHDWLQRPH